VVVSKYADHLPLNRQSEMMKRSVLKSRVIGNDDTRVMMQLNHKNGGRKTCYLWSSTGDQSEVYFDFTTSRERAGSTKFFGGYSGTLVVDGYSGYNELFAKGRAREAGCWAHARRYFVEAMRSNPGDASWVVSEISRMYEIEKEVRDWSADARCRKRQEQTRVIVEDMFVKLEEWKVSALPKSAWGKAVQYVLNRKQALLVFLEDGEVPIDNNATERSIRSIAVGRKNWLFTGSVDGGKRAAGLYSLIGTCKLQGVEPWEYLRDVMARAPLLSDEELSMLTPRLWKAARETVGV